MVVGLLACLSNLQVTVSNQNVFRENEQKGLLNHYNFILHIKYLDKVHQSYFIKFRQYKLFGETTLD